MKSWLLSFILICSVQILSAQIKAAKALTKNVVSITAEYRGVSTSHKHGYGFIVNYESSNKEFFVVTAAHVVADRALAAKPADEIQLTFYPNQTVLAEVVELHEDKDLAVLKVKLSGNYQWIRKCITDVVKDMAVTYIGWNDSPNPPPKGTEGKIITIDIGTLLTDLKGVQPGTSGAPLIASRGIVGMILESDGKSARAISIKTIKESIREKHFGLKYPRRPFKEPCDDIEPKFFRVGVPGALSYRLPYSVTLDNVPLSIRRLGPHPDDVIFREMDIIPPPYTIGPERSTFKIPALYSFELVQVSLFHGNVWIGLRNSALLTDSEETFERNFHRMNYLKNPQPDDNAYIYYGLTTAAKGLIFSIPITVGIPLKSNWGIRNPKTLRFILSTNLLNPSIKLLAQKGWDRFGTREIESGPFEIGRIVEYSGTFGFNIQDCRLFSYGLAATFNVPRFNARSDNTEYEKIELQHKAQLGIVLHISKFFQ